MRNIFECGDPVRRTGGKLIIPTYVNKDKAKGFDKTIDKAGADFKQDFTYDTYREFFARAGYKGIQTKLLFFISFCPC